MRNPLNRRIIKEIKGQFGKFLVIFIFLIGTIGFISGFLVAGDSIIYTYDESFTKYNIEDGNFDVKNKLDNSQISEIEDSNVKIYENFYVEKEYKNTTLRIFKNREEINKVSIFDGKLPKSEDEIALDRLYAKSNDLSINDKIKIDYREYIITGLVALSDYSALFEDNSDMMFNKTVFGVAIVNKSAFETFNEEDLFYRYSWKYNNEVKDEIEEKELFDNLLKEISKNAEITNCIPRYMNQSINCVGEDLGGDKSMMITLLYILIIIISFIFAITISDTISKESVIIGTLRASGYTRNEILFHYIAPPIIVSFSAAIIGNILGYTVFKDAVKELYYGSYSLTKLETIFNTEAFIVSTILPIIIMLIINLVFISYKLKLSPLKFLKSDLKSNKRKKALPLKRFKFLTRFRFRIILQNIPNYLIIFIGVILANTILLMGMMLEPLLNNYQEEVAQKLIANYQYVLNQPIEVENTQAEKCQIYSLKTITDDNYSEEISIYGIEENSRYLNFVIPENEVVISKGYSEKYLINIGDVIELSEKYSDKKYKFKVGGIYDYPASLSVFINRNMFNDIFDKNEDYFNSYFSNEKLEEIDKKYVEKVITVEDYNKIVMQLDESMGEVFNMVKIFSIILFIIFVYLLSKLIIEKNQWSISMIKVLGYNNSEVGKLYIVSTSIVVILSIILSLPICKAILGLLYRSMMFKFTGWISYSIESNVYIWMIIFGIASYLVVALLEMYKIKKIPMRDALKTSE